MAARTIQGGLVTYRRASDGQWSHGMYLDVVDVHEDDIERFDRLNPEPLPEQSEEPDVDVHEDEDPPAYPDGDPSESWTGKQLDAYATAKGIDFAGAKNKAEKVAALTAAAAAGDAA